MIETSFVVQSPPREEGQDIVAVAPHPYNGQLLTFAQLYNAKSARKVEGFEGLIAALRDFRHC